ncbi:MAG: hypothetical protein B7Y82_03705 [Sphingomonadales bacterium 32-65-25]|nr:MAG: hypothetical protein B7Y82_03705 [Sphingomonadales bacterium 32-65-25]
MKFSCFVAMSVVLIAQVASAQVPLKPEPVNKQAVTLKAVTPHFRGGSVAEVTFGNGTVWFANIVGGSYYRPGTPFPVAPTVAGVKVGEDDLKAGMSCVFSGLRGTKKGNVITTLAC